MSNRLKYFHFEEKWKVVSATENRVFRPSAIPVVLFVGHYLQLKPVLWSAFIVIMIIVCYICCCGTEYTGEHNWNEWVI